MSIFDTSNVVNFTQCILELVLNSLKSNATSIAIRFHIQNRKIQVVDNGTGIPRTLLKNIGEYHEQGVNSPRNLQDSCNLKKQTLINIRRLSDAMMITSRYHDSPKTYMKVFKLHRIPNIVKVERRPSHGTTVSIYGFHELTFNKTWNISLMYFLIANIAAVNTQVSFTIRDDQCRKVIMVITKPHNPLEIFKLLYDTDVSLSNLWYIKSKKSCDVKFCAYIGVLNMSSKVTQQIFLNNKPVHCPVILQQISTAFTNILHMSVKKSSQRIVKKQDIFILLFITCEDFIFVIDKGKKTLVLPSIQDLLTNIRNDILNIFTKNSTPVSSCVSKYVRRHRHLVYSQVNDLNATELFSSTLIPCHMENSRKMFGNSVPSTVARNNLLLKDLPLFGTADRSSGKEDREKLFHESRRNPFFLLNNKIKENSTRHKFCRIVSTKVTKVDISKRQVSKTNANNINNTAEAKISNVKKRSFTAAEHWNQQERNALIDGLCTPIQQNGNLIEDNLLSVSEWSNWSYNELQTVAKQDAPKMNIFNVNFSENNKRFTFLPKKLRKLLKCSSRKLTKIDSLGGSGRSIYSAKLKCGLRFPNAVYQEVDVRPCKSIQPFCEFRLKKKLLKFVKVLGQANNEVIAGIIMQDNIKVLLVMDQHAIHERIRYEKLLDKYKSQDQNQLLSVKLKDPIFLQLSTDTYNLLLSNEIILKRFGINLSFTNGHTVTVYRVPECLKRNKYYYNELKLKLNVQNLLREISQNVITTNGHSQMKNLPFTIHNAIATEACHGAVKFGDTLTLKQCKWLLQLLRETKIPTRCAHGRPSVVPILDLSELERRHKISQVSISLNIHKMYILAKVIGPF